MIVWLLNEYKIYIGDILDEKNPWIQKYTPIKILSEIKNADTEYYVKVYMGTYGINNVRGGSIYTEEILSPYQIHELRTELYTHTRVCFGCGSNKHMRCRGIQDSSKKSCVIF